jgi:hypothetical protein
MNAIGGISKNIDEEIAECKAEIAELEGGGTIISAVINFAKESGEALFSSVSSSDNGKKNPEDKDKKLKELKTKLSDLLEKKKGPGQDGESPDSPDGLSEDELKGDNNPLADYVNQLKEAGTPYEVVRKGTMIGIKTTSRGGDPNSMSSVLKNMMEKVGGKLLGSPEDSLVDKTSGSALDEDVKSQVKTVIPSMKKQGVSDFSDMKTKGEDNNSWYGDEQVLDSTSKSLSEHSKAELFAATPINQNQEAIDLMHLQVSSAKETAARGRTALMPVQIGDNHWVGGAMTQEGDKFKFIHNDPLGNKIDPNLRGVLESQGVDVIDLQHRQQTDAHNCGPYTADNLSKFAEAIENKGGLDLSSEQFKEKLKGELRSNGDQIREEQQGRGGFASPITPQTNSASKGSEGRG